MKPDKQATCTANTRKAAVSSYGWRYFDIAAAYNAPASSCSTRLAALHADAALAQAASDQLIPA